ncbi:MAG TPA: hypothetical protein QGI22_01265 [Candidatus Woesearchaeota archaeon]|jgi:PBP1b-binding outer membrane lipoprotein LpoB|nr:hypothetical protein [Candidatus Woesearchaeota archaeon]|tara:strand:- start:55913 stop:56152 length:240 start_codon:yes stop_codon:yes gene_type:complete
MLKKILIAFSLIMALMLFAGCDQQEMQAPEQTTEELEETGEEAVDEVGTGISSIDDVDQELGADELEDLDDVLSDIEQI